MNLTARAVKGNAKKYRLEATSLGGFGLCALLSMVFSYLRFPGATTYSGNGSMTGSALFPILTLFVMLICAFSFLVCLTILIIHPPLLVRDTPVPQSALEPQLNQLVDEKIAHFFEGEVLRFESLLAGISAAENVITFFATINIFLFAVYFSLTV